MKGAAVAALFVLLAACTAAERRVSGTLEGEPGPGGASRAVREEIRTADPASDGRFECLWDADGVRVWSMLRSTGAFSSMGYGVVVDCGEQRAAFPEIRHGNMPAARYERQHSVLWLTAADMEGSGVRAERLYRLHAGDDGIRIEASLSPYALQEALKGRLGYRIQGQDVSLYADGRLLTTVTNHELGMGAFYDDAVWIGEQIVFDISGPVRALVAPGLCFDTGKVLFYDDMPTLSVPVSLTAEGFTLGEITLDEP